MALAAGDLFVVQKDPGGALAKVTAQELNDYLEASDSVTYKGAKDFGASLDDPGNGTLNTGDLYINTGDTDGPWAWANGPSPTPNPVSSGDRAIWNGTSWDYFSDGIQDAGVETVSGGVAITITGSPANPTVDADYASTTAPGVVQVATDADVTAGNVGNPAELVVTAAQLYATEQKIANAGGGTVTEVSAAADSPLTVATGTTTPVIDIVEATEVLQGSVRFATDAEAAAGVVTDAAVTPVQLAANVPSDLGVETIVETDDASAVSGAMVISGPDADGEVKIGVQADVFCPYNFKSLPDA